MQLLRFFIFLCVVFSVHGEETGDPLKSLFQDAQESDESLQKRVNRYLQSQEAVKIANANLKPQVHGSAGIDFFNNNIHGSRDRRWVGIDARMPLIDFTRFIAKTKSVENRRAARIQLGAEKQIFILDFMDRVLQLSERKARYYFAREEGRFLEKFYAKIRQDERTKALERFLENNPGLGESDFVFEDEDSLTLMRTRIELHRQARLVSDLLDRFYNTRDEIETTLIERDLPEFYLLKPYKVERLFDGELQDILPVILTKNHSILASKSGLRMAELDLEAAKKSGFPTVYLNAGSRGDYYSDSKTNNEDWNNNFLGISLDIPLFDWGKRKAERKMASLDAQNAELDLQELSQSVVFESKKTHRDLDTHFDQLNLLVESFLVSQENLEKFIGSSGDSNFAAVDEVIEPVGIYEQRSIIVGHFRLAQELLLRQHSYLKRYFYFLLLQGALDEEIFDFLKKEEFLVNCESFEDFLGLQENFLERSSLRSGGVDR